MGLPFMMLPGLFLPERLGGIEDDTEKITLCWCCPLIFKVLCHDERAST